LGRVGEDEESGGEQGERKLMQHRERESRLTVDAGVFTGREEAEAE